MRQVASIANDGEPKFLGPVGCL